MKPNGIEEGQHHNQDAYFPALLADLRSARALVIIMSTYLSRNRILDLQSPLEDCIRRGVRVCCHVQKPRDEFGDPNFPKIYNRFLSNVQLLRTLGLHVMVRTKPHQKAVVIDESILYDGTLNTLSYRDTDENMTRYTAREKIVDTIFRYDLDYCEECFLAHKTSLIRHPNSIELQQKRFGATIERRRIQLGLSRASLAEQAGVHPRVLARLLRGDGNSTMKTIMQVCEALQLKCEALPWYIMPATDLMQGL